MNVDREDEEVVDVARPRPGRRSESRYAARPAQPDVCTAWRQSLSETLTFQPIRP